MRTVILLLVLASTLYSCKGQSKRSDRNAVVIYGDSVLQNYSYKGYDIDLFAYRGYSVSFNVGDEWLVVYNKNENASVVMERHQIADTISLYSPFGFEGRFVIAPIFDDGSICHNSYLEDMFIFKGFDSFNTHLAEDLRDSYITPRYDIETERTTKKGYNKISDSWRRKGTRYYYTDILYEKKGLNEIIYSDGSKEQVLIRNYSAREWMQKYRLHKIFDIDGDGLGDLIIRTYGSIVTPNPDDKDYNEETAFLSDLLFLSSRLTKMSC